MAILLNGKALSETMYEFLKQSITHDVATGKRRPKLVAILVGNDPASETYVLAKMRACEKVGMLSSILRFPETIREAQLIQEIKKLNQDVMVDGFIVQLPLPKHIDNQKIMEAIHPNKDVDGFHPLNIGNMVLGQPGLKPATPSGILDLLSHYNISTEGKHCVVLGRSNIVGTPIAIMLSQKNAPGNCTVTICHSKTPDIAYHTKQADILIVAIGKEEFITRDMVKPGAVVIDVGIHRKILNGIKTLCGDVNFKDIEGVCSYITPVPGGVGPLTIASLLKNTYKAYRKNMVN